MPIVYYERHNSQNKHRDARDVLDSTVNYDGMGYERRTDEKIDVLVNIISELCEKLNIDVTDFKDVRSYFGSNTQ